MQCVVPSQIPASAPVQPSPAALRHGVVPMPNLAWTPEVARETAHLYEKVKSVIPPIEWPFHAPYVKAINDLKKERNAVILAHNYQTPEIYNCVADVVGDSLQLARIASQSDAEVIVQGGVHFMAETSKILSPDKTVLIPDSRAGCSLAASITGGRRPRPAPRISGRSDRRLCQHLGRGEGGGRHLLHLGQCAESGRKPGKSTRVIMVPDRFLAANVARQTKVKIIAWHGACEVHERFTPEELLRYREDDPSIKLIAHPECPPEVVEVCDFSGSTAAMIDYVKTRQPKRVLLVTECSMADNVAAENPGVNFVRPCNLCPHMKRITLPKILDSLVYMREEVVVDPALAARARRSVERMIELK